MTRDDRREHRAAHAPDDSVRNALQGHTKQRTGIAFAIRWTGWFLSQQKCTGKDKPTDHHNHKNECWQKVKSDRHDDFGVSLQTTALTSPASLCLLRVLPVFSAAFP